MVQAENIDSGISNFQLDNRSGRDHHSLAHLSKFPLREACPLFPHDEASHYGWRVSGAQTSLGGLLVTYPKAWSPARPARQLPLVR
jgi:folate-binding Fe-S cluster repair protein YgfZ